MPEEVPEPEPEAEEEEEVEEITEVEEIEEKKEKPIKDLPKGCESFFSWCTIQQYIPAGSN